MNLTLSQHVKRTFSRLTPESVAQEELAEAKLKLLQAQTAVEWAQAEVDYNTKRIQRLEAMLQPSRA